MQVNILKPLEGNERWFEICHCGTVQAAVAIIEHLLHHDKNTTCILKIIRMREETDEASERELPL